MYKVLKLVFIAFAICVANADEEYKQKRGRLQSFNAVRKIACTEILRESQWFQYGFDATELDFYKCPEIGGKRQQIFVFDNCDGRTWKNKYTNETFDLPNNLDVYPIASDSNNPRSFSDFHAYVDDLKADVKIEYVEEHGLFSLSTDYQNIQEKLAKNTLIVIQRKTVLYTVGYREELKEPTLHENFHAISNNLPKNFKQNSPKFIDFIKTFGTHYVFSAGFGGTVRRLRTFEKSKWKQYSTNDMILRAHKDFPSLSSSDKEICKDSKFNLTYKYSGSDYEQQYFGISPEQLKEIGFEKWSSVIAKNPYVVSLQLQPISKILVGDLALEMGKAIKAYMAKAYLDESVRKLKIQLSIGLPKTNYTDDYLEQYEEINKTNNYDLQSIRDLTSKIRFEARQPVPIVIDGSNCVRLNSFIKYSLFIFAFIKCVAIP